MSSTSTVSTPGSALPIRLSNTTAGANPGVGGVPVYDRQYMTLHTLQEREMRARLDSEKMIRNDLTHIQEGMASVTNQIQEVAGDLKGNLPRLYQETKELRRETQQLTIAFHHNSSEVQSLNQRMEEMMRDVGDRFSRMESKLEAFQAADRKEKDDMWAKLCTKVVVQDLGDRVGCLDQETHAKFEERRVEVTNAIAQVASSEKKVEKAMDEFKVGLSKQKFLVEQAQIQRKEYQSATSRVVSENRELIDTVIFPRVERCEQMLQQEMNERVECLTKIAQELVHAKDVSDAVRKQVDAMNVELGIAVADYAALTVTSEGDSSVLAALNRGGEASENGNNKNLSCPSAFYTNTNNMAMGPTASQAKMGALPNMPHILKPTSYSISIQQPFGVALTRMPVPQQSSFGQRE